ncbi:universal stress protein [Streptomyces sp. NBC_00503]|uniref:universal stress protein n=1 Tax=Streptomyces sp. NBC_00503 TaxID=2903659 RepID=UPI002E8219E0|nr:universal stress protein [Streptomyces sp. NBC_00503]WUD79719.1 universal stress protein [Streptomyces sp. NBC_00503]
MLDQSLIPPQRCSPRPPARTVTVGFDGSRASLAAVSWAAAEARRRGVALRLLHVWDLGPDVHSPLVGHGVPEADPRATAARVRHDHPGLSVFTLDRCGEPASVLCRAAGASEMLVLGSRGLGGPAGFAVGSVALTVVARTRRPIVLVRDPVPMTGGDVVLGLDLSHPCDEVLEFAFSHANLRGAPLRVVHSPHPSGDHGPEAAGRGIPADTAAASHRLARVIDQWQHAFPGVRVTAEIRPGRTARQLLAASGTAGLVVIGRRNRNSRLGPHTGVVNRTMLHHCRVPMAVVPHD